MAALRDGFDAVPELYHRVRHRYPAALFSELFSHLPARPDVVEVGPGTGQATGSLLEHQATVTAVELGANLAAHLRTTYSDVPQLRVLVSSFEGAVLPARSFDAVVAATAYHWVEAPFRLQKPAQLLRPDGWIAIIDTVQVSAASDRGFFERVQPIYQRHGEPAHHPSPPRPDEATSPIFKELGRSALFSQPLLYRYRWDQTYDTASYGDLMRSYSVTRAMPSERAEDLIADISDLIAREFDGEVTRPLVITLTMAQVRHHG